MKTRASIFLVALSMVAFCATVRAAETNEEGGWEFAIDPYMWALGLGGNVTVRGQKSGVDLSFGDIWDDLNLAGMLEFEVRKGRFGFFINPLYAALEDDERISGCGQSQEFDESYH